MHLYEKDASSTASQIRLEHLPFYQVVTGSRPVRPAPFPMMKEIYTAKPLTPDEIASLSTFLKETSNVALAPAQDSSLFVVIGGVAALVIIGLFQLLWRGRLAGVRRPLVKGGSK